MIRCPSVKGTALSLHRSTPIDANACSNTHDTIGLVTLCVGFFCSSNSSSIDSIFSVKSVILVQTADCADADVLSAIKTIVSSSFCDASIFFVNARKRSCLSSLSASSSFCAINPIVKFPAYPSHAQVQWSALHLYALFPWGAELHASFPSVQLQSGSMEYQKREWLKSW